MSDTGQWLYRLHYRFVVLLYVLHCHILMIVPETAALDPNPWGVEGARETAQMTIENMGLICSLVSRVDMALVLPVVKLDAGGDFDLRAWERIGRTRELIGQARLLTRIAAIGNYPAASLMHKIYAAAIFHNGRRFVETFARIFEGAERAIVDVDASAKMIDNVPT